MEQDDIIEQLETIVNLISRQCEDSLSKLDDPREVQDIYRNAKQGFEHILVLIYADKD